MIETLEYLLTGITALATVVGYIVIFAAITGIALIKSQNKEGP